MSKVSTFLVLPFSVWLMLNMLNSACAQPAVRIVITRWIIRMSERDSVGVIMPCPSSAQTPYSITYTNSAYTNNFTQCHSATNYYVPQQYLLEPTMIQGGCTNTSRWFTRFPDYQSLIQAGVRPRGPCDPSFRLFEIPESARYNASADTCYTNLVGASSLTYEFYKIECKSFDPSSMIVNPYTPPNYDSGGNSGSSASHIVSFSPVSCFIFVFMLLAVIFL